MYSAIPVEDLGVGFQEEADQQLAENQLQDDLAREEETDYFDQGIIGRDNQGALIDNAINNLVGGLLSNQGPSVGLLVMLLPLMLLLRVFWTICSSLTTTLVTKVGLLIWDH